MDHTRHPGDGADPSPPRVLGRLRGEAPGPMLLVVAGIHGNEPSGVRAATTVLERIQSDGRLRGLRGDLVVLAGNRAALGRCERFIERDLNRGWSDAQIRMLRERAAREGGLLAEDGEQLELLEEIERALNAARGPRHFV